MKKIMWITNQPTPEIATQIGIPPIIGGGWLNQLSKQLAKEYDFSMLFPIDNKMPSISGNKDGIMYFGLPMNLKQTKLDVKCVKKIESVISHYKPDIIHIWGTEYIHSYMVLLACDRVTFDCRVVISIQGLVSIITRHFWGFISESKIKRLSVRDVFFYDNSLNKMYINFKKRGMYECLAIKNVKNVIGRTDWDEACIKQINPQVQYYRCNETLRSIFYENKWDISKCERHSVFISNSQYPIKGAHLAMEAISILKKKYTDIKLYIVGYDVLKKPWKSCVLGERYEKYLVEKIYKLGIEKNVEFLGYLDEEEMCSRFCNSHVYVCSSTIENSPNSLAEAMCLGMPIVAADVGGVKNMLLHEKEGFIYQADAPYMMAYYIEKLFSNDMLAVECGTRAREHAMKTHDSYQNKMTLQKIYEVMV